MKDFLDFLDEHNANLVAPKQGDGSMNVDDVDCSWRIDDKSIYDIPLQQCWTVLDCDGEMIVTAGLRYVNRMFYLVVDRELSIDEDFSY